MSYHSKAIVLLFAAMFLSSGLTATAGERILNNGLKAPGGVRDPLILNNNDDIVAVYRVNPQTGERELIAHASWAHSGHGPFDPNACKFAFVANAQGIQPLTNIECGRNAFGGLYDTILPAGIGALGAVEAAKAIRPDETTVNATGGSSSSHSYSEGGYAFSSATAMTKNDIAVLVNQLQNNLQYQQAFQDNRTLQFRGHLVKKLH